jgi:hypothetical protein
MFVLRLAISSAVARLHECMGYTQGVVHCLKKSRLRNSDFLIRTAPGPTEGQGVRWALHGKGGVRHAATNWVKQYDAPAMCRRPLESTAVCLATNHEPPGHFSWQCHRDPLMGRATALAPGYALQLALLFISYISSEMRRPNAGNHWPSVGGGAISYQVNALRLLRQSR